MSRPSVLNIPLLGDAQELLRVFYLIIAALRGKVKSMADAASVVGVCGSAASCETEIVSAYDAVRVTAADTSRCLGCDTAGSHGADTAACAGLAKTAVRSLIFDSLLPGIGPYLSACLKQLSGSGLHLF